MTTKQKAIRHIRDHAAKAAQEAVQAIRPFTLQDDYFHIAPGTHIRSTIKRELNGFTLSGPAGDIPLHHPGPPGLTRFDAAVRSAQRTTLRTILVSLSTFLGTRPGNPPHLLHKDPDVQHAVAETANQALAHWHRWEEETAGEAGYRLLRSFLGHHIIEATSEAFGTHATLKHLALYSLKPHIIQKATQQHPNATIFLGARSYISNRRPPAFNTPEEAITEAKNIFKADVRFRTPKLRKAPAHEIEDTTDLLWNIFLGIPANIIRNARLDHLYGNLVAICQAAARTQRMPRPHVLETLLANPPVIANAPPPIIDAFIRHGPEAEQPHLRQEAEEQLLGLHALLQANKTATKKGLPPNHAATALETHTEDTPVTWQSLVQAAQADAAEQAKRPRQHPKTPNSLEIYQALGHPGADDVFLIATESPSWTRGQDNTLKFFGPDPYTPFLEILREKDHTVRLRTTEPISQLPVIPSVTRHPHENLRSAPHNRLERLFHSDIALSLMSGAIEHLREVWDQIRPYPYLGRPAKDKSLYAIRSELISAHSNRNYSTDYTLIAQEIDTAINAVTTPQDAERASKHAKHVTTFHYNAVITLGNRLEELAQTNPGALAWAMNQTTDPETLREPIHHPGQVIAMAKAGMEQAGLHPGSWKFAATIDHPIIRETPQGSDHVLVTLLNAMAAAGKPLHPGDASFVINMVLVPAYRSAVTYNQNDPALQDLAKRNITHTLTLLCREYTDSHQRQVLMDQALDTMDYVVHLSKKGETLRSTTWNGLLKASHHWHRDTRQAEILAEWERSHKGKRRKLLTWHSLIGPTTKGDFEVLPITSEYQLFQESRQMKHCVVNYARDCAEGDRIFSVLRNGIKLATSQIKQTPQGWQEVQTRGRDNHQVSADIKAVMQKVAADYDRAHREAEALAGHDAL